jgi:hypothetical protein
MATGRESYADQLQVLQYPTGGSVTPRARIGEGDRDKIKRPSGRLSPLLAAVTV